MFFFPSFFLHFIQIAPVIMSKPDDSYGPLGANLTLDCEARGHPAPTITWRFVNTEGKTIALPSKLCVKYVSSLTEKQPNNNSCCILIVVRNSLI